MPLGAIRQPSCGNSANYCPEFRFLGKRLFRPQAPLIDMVRAAKLAFGINFFLTNAIAPPAETLSSARYNREARCNRGPS